MVALKLILTSIHFSQNTHPLLLCFTIFTYSMFHAQFHNPLSPNKSTNTKYCILHPHSHLMFHVKQTTHLLHKNTHPCKHISYSYSWTFCFSYGSIVYFLVTTISGIRKQDVCERTNWAMDGEWFGAVPLNVTVHICHLEILDTYMEKQKVQL